MNEKQWAFNQADMLRGCVNRLFVTDSSDELQKMYLSGCAYLLKIYEYNRKRLEKEEEE